MTDHDKIEKIARRLYAVDASALFGPDFPYFNVLPRDKQIEYRNKATDWLTFFRSVEQDEAA